MSFANPKIQEWRIRHQAPEQKFASRPLTTRQFVLLSLDRPVVNN